MNRQRLLDLELVLDAESLSSVRGAVRKALADTELGPEDQVAVVLAVDEACANVLRHGYGGEPGDIHLTVSLIGNQLEVLLCDRAEQTDPKCLRPLQPDIDRPGGLGLYLMYKIMDEVTLLPAPREGGNRLLMTKVVPHGD